MIPLKSLPPLKSVSMLNDPENEIRSLRDTPLAQQPDQLTLQIDTHKYSASSIEKMLEDLSLIGLREQKRKDHAGHLDLYLERPPHYRRVEEEREKLGYWGQDQTAPRYSICICNYNMADTLERAISSVARQLDPKLYEVVIIDDGSTDKSVEILGKLADQYSHLRYIALPRDPKRKLGETRNISIRAARGEYVLLHIDADDEWEPYLQDFVTLFHKIEAAAQIDLHLSGQQTGMGKRNSLLRYGPFENIYRCEDRNLMMRLANKKSVLFFDYRVYRTRLSRPKKKKIIKIFYDTGSQLCFEMRQQEAKIIQVFRILMAPIKGGVHPLSIRLIRALLVLPAFIITRFQPPIINHMSWQGLRDYHASNRGTYAELMTRLGGNPDISFLSKEAQEIYSYNVKKPGFQSSR